MLAGLEYPTAGSIRIDGAEMVAVPPNRRPVNMVFQSYAVFPHMSVAENVGYGLRWPAVGRAEIAARVARRWPWCVGRFGRAGRTSCPAASGSGWLWPGPWSSGRGCCCWTNPVGPRRQSARANALELVNLQHSVGITFVMVTHDQDEALSMADRIAVMEAGQIRQLATPYELYERPANRFVAEFIGAINTWPARIDREGVSVDGLGTLAVDSAADRPVRRPWRCGRKKSRFPKRNRWRRDPAVGDAPPTGVFRQ